MLGGLWGFDALTGVAVTPGWASCSSPHQPLRSVFVASHVGQELALDARFGSRSRHA